MPETSHSIVSRRNNASLGHQDINLRIFFAVTKGLERIIHPPQKHAFDVMTKIEGINENI